MFLDIEYVVAVCECIIHFNEGYPFDKKYIDEGYIENYKDLLEECICLNESVFLKDKSIRIRKVKFDGENIWIGEWEEMNDRMRDGMSNLVPFRGGRECNTKHLVKKIFSHKFLVNSLNSHKIL